VLLRDGGGYLSEVTVSAPDMVEAMAKACAIERAPLRSVATVKEYKEG